MDSAIPTPSPAPKASTRPAGRPLKALSTSPLKLSPALGAAMAVLGVEGAMPCLHGAQGCTAFALVLMVRHFREPIALQTTALTEVSTILGGGEIIEQALLNIKKRTDARLIGLATTALTETRGEDIPAEVKRIRRTRPELEGTEVVPINAPDWAGSLESGWSRAVTALITHLVPDQPDPGATSRDPERVAILAGSHLSPADIEDLRDTAEAFGLRPTILPDLSRSLDGHVPDEGWVPTSLGGTPLEEIRTLGSAGAAIAIGAQMSHAAEALASRTGMPVHRLDSVTGLAGSDRLVGLLSRLSGRPVPQRLKRQRSQLVDALMDAHFAFGGTRIALAGEPDLVGALGGLVTGLGATLQVVVTPTAAPHLANLPAEARLVGDLEDLREHAAGCDLMIANTNGRLPAARLGVPLFRAGFPVYDRLGSGQRRAVGYLGTREIVFALGNALLEAQEAAHGHDHDHAHDQDPGHGLLGGEDSPAPAAEARHGLR